MNEHFPDISSLVKVIDSLPALSWLVDLSDRARVFVGPQVEVQLNRESACVFEGCWDGGFDEQDFLASVNFYCSGFVLNQDKIVFSTPTHTLSSLFVLMGRKRKIVSKSLCFIFAYVGMQPTGNFGIAKKTMSIIKGIKSYSKLVYYGPTEKIIRLVYCTFSISGDRIETFDKPEAPHFSNYDDYRQYLHRSLGRLFENARSLKRKRQYEPVVLMSTGYDSVAAAALSANLGCQLALTLRTSREGGADSGKGIAESLGMCCVEKERASPSAVEEPHPEAQFIASGDSGDAVFYVFEEELKNKLVLTGHHGDKVWDPNTLPTKDIKRGDTSGMGMQEFRLRNNFILLPVPFIGVRNQPDIHSISHAPDMQPFRVGGIYDRPICRRIAEEAGVQRKLFGQSKKAVNLFKTETFGSPSTPRSIKSYVAEREGPVFWFQEKILRTIRSLLDAGMLLPSEGSDPVFRLLRKPFRWLAWRVRVAFYENVFNFRKYADYEMFWAIEQTGQRYRVGVGSTKPPRPEGNEASLSASGLLMFSATRQKPQNILPCIKREGSGEKGP